MVDFGDLASSADFGPYFEQGMPSAMPSFTPETSWTAPAGSVKDTGIMTDFAGAATSALPWLQLGTTALGAVSGVQAAQAAGRQAHTAEKAQKVQAESARQAQQVAQSAAAFGQQELSQAAAGQIPGPIQAQIDEWAQAAKQKAMDYAARSGQGDSTMLTTWLSWIDKQAQSMKAAALSRSSSSGSPAFKRRSRDSRVLRPPPAKREPRRLERSTRLIHSLPARTSNSRPSRRVPPKMPCPACQRPTDPAELLIDTDGQWKCLRCVEDHRVKKPA